MQEMERRYFRAAEFAQMAHVNKKTLHYYDSIGLFKPAYVNGKGYRFYTLAQLDRLALIVVLKDLGLSLEEIRQYLECRDARRLEELLEQQDREIDRRIRQLRRTKALLRGLREESRSFLEHDGKGCQVLDWPAQPIAVLMDGDGLRRRQQGFVVNYLTDGLYTGVYYVDGESQFLYQKSETGERVIPGGRYLCLYGSEDEDTQQPARMRYVEQLRRYAAQHGLRLAEGCYFEFADILLAEPGMQYFCVRAQLLEDGAGDNVPKEKDEIL